MGSRSRRIALPISIFIVLGNLACGGANDAAAVDAAADEGADAMPSPIRVLPDEREACAASNPLRNPYFGDLHVHTRFSFDAAAYDVRANPASVYRFARGESQDLPPYDAEGRATRTYQLRRPLDFAAVTDHSELLAETSICTDPDSPGYTTRTCQTYRDADVRVAGYGEFFSSIGLSPPRRVVLCQLMPGLCSASLGEAWEEIQDAAENAYDRTESCSFTSFVGYEWTGTFAGNNIHRNIIFANRSVPRVPISYVDIPDPIEMLMTLDTVCNESDTPCEVVSIPHNGNLGAGDMFRAELSRGVPYTRESASMRARLEPLVEVYQHKGSSECVTGLRHPLASEDEFCSFEQVFEPVCPDGVGSAEGCTPRCEDELGPTFLRGCIGTSDFLRPALRTGLGVYAETGVNPYAHGVIASTDTHNAIAGAVDERTWPGHLGDSEDEAVELVDLDSTTVLRGRSSSPGGLAVLWAEENTRESLFSAMRRREAYGTSGPRMVLRAFAGWELDEGLCGRDDFVEQGYAGGVSMGGELRDAPADGAPRLAIWALRDPMGAALQRVQVIKGWFDGATTHERVYDVGGDATSDASVDLSDCEPQGAGEDQICTVWTDPEFDPSWPTFYYVRVLQNPTCRWSHWVCLEADVDCASISEGDPLIGCCDGHIRSEVQERAWSSPIWYLPEV